ncbi:MAG TPA: lipase family protein, partial [Nannocystis sp.]
MHLRPLSLCLAAITLTTACGDDPGGDTGDSSGEPSTGADAGTTTDTPTTDAPTTAESSGSSGDDTTGDDTGEAAFEVGGCGLPEYPLVATADMGQVLDHAFVIEFEPATIDALLEGQGFGALTPVKYGARVYKIRYVTQDRGEAVEATGFVSLPVGATVEERPVVLWAHGTTGFTDKCAPTAAADGYVVPALLAALGYVSVAPDYLGMNGWGAASGFIHPYIVPEPTAIATLDSLRALARFGVDTGEEMSATPGKDIILFGASEGGFATLWADRYAPFYAPEFKILANVASV